MFGNLFRALEADGHLDHLNEVDIYILLAFMSLYQELARPRIGLTKEYVYLLFLRTYLYIYGTY